MGEGAGCRVGAGRWASTSRRHQSPSDGCACGVEVAVPAQALGHALGPACTRWARGKAAACLRARWRRPARN